MPATEIRRSKCALFFAISMINLISTGWILGAEAKPVQKDGQKETQVNDQAKANALVQKLLERTELLEDGSVEKSQAIDAAFNSAMEQDLFEPFFRSLVDKLGALSKSTEPEKSWRVLTVAKQISQKTSLPTSLEHGRIWMYEGTLYMREKNFLEAIRSFRKAEANFEDYPTEMSKVQSFLGTSLIEFGAPIEDSIVALKKSIESAETGSYFQTMAASNLVALYLRTEQFEEARDVLSAKLINEKYSGCKAKLLNAELLLNQGELEEATELCNEVISKIEKEGGLSMTLRIAYLVRALCFEHNENWSGAIQSLNDALEQPRRKEEVMLRIGKVYAKSGDAPKAIAYFKDSLNSPSLLVRELATQELIKTYESENQLEEALVYSKLARELQQEREQQMVILAQTEYEPILDLAKFKLVAQKAERSRTKAEAMEQKSAAYRIARNWTAVGAVLLILGTLLFFRTEIRRRETELMVAESKKRSKLEMQLEQKKRIEAIGQLTGNVAHDFNNVLQVVSHTNHLIKESLHSELTNEQKMLFRSSNDSVEIGAKISEQLLTFAKKQATNPQVARVTELFDSSKLLFASVGGETMEVNVEYMQSDLAINVDRAQFSNAILNLLINAKDATEGKGVVDILVSGIDMGPVQADQWQLKPGSYVRIDVIDSGRGMTAEQQMKACEPFFTTKSPATGTGLGLSSVKGFVEQASGSMQISSAPNEGTTVSIVFPECFLELSSQQSVHETAKESSQSSLSKFLIVEDNDSVRESLELMVEQLGYECASCVNADSARDFLLEHDDIHIVISDIRMPGEMDGVDLAEWIFEEMPDVKVILVSGNEAPMPFSQCQFLRKPFRFKDLANAIELAAEGIEHLPTAVVKQS